MDRSPRRPHRNADALAFQNPERRPVVLLVAGRHHVLVRRLGVRRPAAYTTTDPNYKLRITIDYEDEAGYQWRRTDTSQPRRTDDAPHRGTGTELWWRLD